MRYQVSTPTRSPFAGVFYRNVCACGAPRAGLARFCGDCGRSLHRKSWSLLAALAMVGLLLLLSPSPPPSGISKADSKRVNPHLLGMAPNPAPKSQGSRPDPREPAAVLGRIEALLGQTRGQPRAFAEAIALLDGLIDRFPDYAYGLRLKGNLLRAANKPAGAVEAYQRYLAANPEDMKVRFSLAQSLFLLEAHAASLEELRKVAAAYPRFGAVHGQMARVYQALGREGEAVAARDRALALKEEGGQTKPPLIWQPRIPDAAGNSPLADRKKFP